MTPEEMIKLHNKKKLEELKLLKELNKDVKRNLKELQSEIQLSIDEMDERVDAWDRTELAKYDRMNKLNKDIEEKVKKYKGKEWEMMLSFLVLNANLMKKNTADLLSTSIGAQVSVKPVFKVTMNEITGNPWSGLSMHLRHRRATDELIVKTREAVTLSIMHEDKKEAKKAIEKVLETSNKRAEQLIKTEKTHIDDEMAKETLIEIGVKSRLLYNATFDNTCSECASHHGEVYELNDAPELPRHVNCQCFYTPILVE